MEFSKYSVSELEQLKKDIDKEMDRRRKQSAKKAQQELKEVADKYGFNLSELVGSSANRGGRSKAPAKYRHPDDASKTWTGRGRKPGWIKEWEAAGRSLKDLRVK